MTVVEFGAICDGTVWGTLSGMSAEFQPPAVGSIVHYAEFAGPELTCRAAIVTATPDTGGEFDLSALMVLLPDGLRFVPGVAHGHLPESGAWHWPTEAGEREV